MIATAVFGFLCGCGQPPPVDLDPDGTESAELEPGSVTWHDDIAPIFAVNCITCHQPGGLMEAIDLHEFEDSHQWRGRIAEMVADEGMPPFPADTSEECPQPWGFDHDRRMSDQDIATVLAWVQDDAPEGDPANEQTYTAPPEVHLDRVDMTLGLPDVQTIPPVTEIPDVISCFVLDPELEETGYMLGMETVPDNRKVLHHVGAYLSDRAYIAALDEAVDGVADGQFLCPNMGSLGDAIGGYVPGVLPLITPEGSAVQVEPNEVFVASIHYHGVETEQQDMTTFDFKWADGPTERLAVTLKSQTSQTANAGLLPGPNDRTSAPEFFIPAGEAWHTESMYWDVKGTGDRTIYSMLGHMHLAGTFMRVSIERADGTPGPCILEIPRWNFDWQLFYTLGDQDDLPVLHTGDRVLIECTFDNTENNPGVVRIMEEVGLDEPTDIHYGGGSTEEMCSLVLGMVEG